MFDQVLTVHFELNVFHRSRSTIFCPTSAGSSLPCDGDQGKERVRSRRQGGSKRGEEI